MQQNVTKKLQKLQPKVIVQKPVHKRQLTCYMEHTVHKMIDKKITPPTYTKNKSVPNFIKEISSNF